MINGNTGLIAHIGYPTHAFKSPMIYNPYFEHAGVNAVVVPMGCKPEHYPAFLNSVFSLENIRGALITMPHKVTAVGLLDDATPTVKIAGSCNAARRMEDGRLLGDMFDGEASCAACGARAASSKVRGRSSSAVAESARRSQRRWLRPASRGSASSMRAPSRRKA
jgi:shikimate dehydrogenase